MSFELNFNIITITVVFNLFIYLFFYKIVHFYNIYDIPDDFRKFHKKKVPLVGGLIFLLNIFFVFFLEFFINDSILFNLLSFQHFREKIIFFIISLSIFFIGYYDDKFSLNPFRRLFLLFFAIYIFLIFSETTRINYINFNFYNFEYFYLLSSENLFFTAFSIIVLINIFNFFDGINLQLMFYSLLIFCFLFYKFNVDQIILLIIPLIFLCYYNYKDKLFLGDSGAYLLAFIISIFLINSHNLKLVDSFEVFALLSLPFFDSVRIILRRIVLKKKVYEADYNHFHHILIRFYGIKKSQFLICLINFVLIFLVIFNYNLTILLSFIIIILSEYFLIKFDKKVVKKK